MNSHCIFQVHITEQIFWLNHIYIYEKYVHRCIKMYKEEKKKRERVKITFAAFSTIHKMKNYEM